MFKVRPSAAHPGAGFDGWHSPAMGAKTASGQAVSPERALALTAVYACVKVISEAVMQLPLILYKRLPDNGKERAHAHPLFSLLRLQPNDEQTAAEWREVMQYHLLLRGNAYSKVVRDGAGMARELGVPIHPDWVTIESREDNRYRYAIRPPMGNPYTLLPDEILHVRALAVNGRMGMSPIEVERESVGVGLAAQDMAGRFLANDATPPGHLTHPTHFATDEDRIKFGRSWQAAQSGVNHGKTAVLEHGITYTPVSVKLRDAEFLATRKYQNIEVCRIFRVPPHLIMELERATFSNISSQGIEFVKFTLVPWLVRWEQRLNADLLGDQQYFFEYLVDGLERGDPTTRSDYYTKGIQSGWFTRNEARIKENLNPLPGLNEPLQPLNMGSGDAATEPDDDARALAATNLSKKWVHMMAERCGDVAEREQFMLNEMGRVCTFIGCDHADAVWYCSMAADDLRRFDSMDEWAEVQAERLSKGIQQ